MAARFVCLAASCYLAPMAASGEEFRHIYGIAVETGAGPRGTPPGPFWNVVNTASV